MAERQPQATPRLLMFGCVVVVKRGVNGGYYLGATVLVLLLGVDTLRNREIPIVLLVDRAWLSFWGMDEIFRKIYLLDALLNFSASSTDLSLKVEYRFHDDIHYLLLYSKPEHFWRLGEIKQCNLVCVFVCVVNAQPQAPSGKVILIAMTKNNRERDFLKILDSDFQKRYLYGPVRKGRHA